MEKIADIVTVVLPLEELYEYPINPNKQDGRTFNALLADIQEDGFDEPLEVVPRHVTEPGMRGYTVVSGNHRLKALRKLQYTQVACIIKDWDAETCKIKVMRRNMIRGDVDTAQFTKLVDSIQNPYTPDQLVEAMGLKDIQHFDQLYTKEKAEFEPEAEDADPAKFYEGMTSVLNQLFAEYGDTVPHSFMYFVFGSRVHLAVNMTSQLKSLVHDITVQAKRDRVDLAQLLTGVVHAGLKATEGDTKKLLLAGKTESGNDFRFEPIVGRTADEYTKGGG